MAALQILVLSVQVRVLVGQQNASHAAVRDVFFYAYGIMYGGRSDTVVGDSRGGFGKAVAVFVGM